MSTKPLALVLCGIVVALAVPACDLNIPDLNNPGLEQLENNPTVAGVNAAATGMLVGNRGAKSATTGLVNALGILGREAYDFDPNDGRFVTEYIQGNLNRGSPFGSQFWQPNYANIRLGNIILHALDKLTAFDDPANADKQKSAMRGFVHTMQAMELMVIILTHDDTGAVIDTDLPLGAPLAPIVPKADVYKKINDLLDQGQMELMASLPADPTKSAFTFPLSPGYKGFDTPATFITFNRAIRARIAVYTKDYTGALTALGASFLVDDPAAKGFSFNTGTFYVYSTNAGDQINALLNKSIFAHPSLLTDVQKQADGTTLDARYTAKVKNLDKPITSTIDSSLKTSITFQIYTNTSPIGVIRNEELILLKAEALWFSGDHTGAVTELNIVRTGSGKLPALDPAAITTNDQFRDALLYERRYSLMFEGGYRWIDLRRFGIPLPLDAPTHTRNIRYPIQQPECDQRPGEPACMINSSDPVN